MQYHRIFKFAIARTCILVTAWSHFGLRNKDNGRNIGDIFRYLGQGVLWIYRGLEFSRQDKKAKIFLGVGMKMRLCPFLVK